MAKSELELEEERRLAENRKATQSRGIGSEIVDKIKNNPWKTLGTVLYTGLIYQDKFSLILFPFLYVAFKQHFVNNHDKHSWVFDTQY